MPCLGFALVVLGLSLAMPAPSPAQGVAAPAMAVPAASQVHVVRKGDTLSGIALRYRVSVKQLRRWNSLKGDRIIVGQRLALREGARPARAPVDPLKVVFSSWTDTVIDQSRRDGTYALVVNKTERRMDVYLSGRRVNTFRVAIGYADAKDLTDRQLAGDHHLKEGVFHLSEVAWSNQIPKWDRVWMRIHTVEAAKRDYVRVYGETGRRKLAAWEAARGAVVTDVDVQNYNRAHRDMNIWRGLGIHGGGSLYDWTEGCVALDRKDIRWLYDRLKGARNGGVGTPLAVVRF
ncbi:MAG: L,D-transpeptidase family protein [Gemmatimonadota bacterium]